jgi:hypothetical protein
VLPGAGHLDVRRVRPIQTCDLLATSTSQWTTAVDQRSAHDEAPICLDDAQWSGVSRGRWRRLKLTIVPGQIGWLTTSTATRSAHARAKSAPADTPVVSVNRSSAKLFSERASSRAFSSSKQSSFIRRTVMESRTVGDRLEAFFEEFVEQLLLKDLESILTFNHSYRFRDAIVDLARRRIAHTPSMMQVLCEEYVAASISPSMAEAALDVEGDLLAIESTFGQIGERFERIESFRRQLEARVRNTIKYAERGAHGLVIRAGDLVRRLDGSVGRGRHPNATVEWSLEPLRTPWSEFHHAPSREPRKPLETQLLGDRPSDPLYELRKQLRLDYSSRISPGPAEVRKFLEKQVPPAGTKEARFIPLETVDDFLAFDAARRLL